MKQLITIIAVLSFSFCYGQTTAIPDANFEQRLINLGYDTGTPDGFVPTANIDTITFLNVMSQGISDLTGIEDFTALSALYCDFNQLTSLNISGCTALDTLSCIFNQLTSLNVSNNTALTFLACSINHLTSLDVSNNTALTHLYCGDNQFTSLGVSNNTALFTLHCASNQLTRLEVS